MGEYKSERRTRPMMTRQRSIDMAAQASKQEMVFENVVHGSQFTVHGPYMFFFIHILRKIPRHLLSPGWSGGWVERLQGRSLGVHLLTISSHSLCSNGEKLTMGFWGVFMYGRDGIVGGGKSRL